eukprot:1374135-Amorphochlora_amoeboformis.AAC.1
MSQGCKNSNLTPRYIKLRISPVPPLFTEGEGGREVLEGKEEMDFKDGGTPRRREDRRELSKGWAAGRDGAII